MRQLSLVAFYGEKPTTLNALLQDCQDKISARIGDPFKPYALEQIHGTLIGLETTGGHNRNLVRTRNVEATMDLQGFLEHVRNVFREPMTIRFGGFSRTFQSFDSRGRFPHERGFSIQGDRVVLMGWPAAPRDGRVDWPRSLADLRQTAETFGIGHAYHVTAEDRDNDFYLRLGLLDEPIDDIARQEVESQIRTDLGNGDGHHVELAADQIAVVDYDDESLPLSSTVRRAL